MITLAAVLICVILGVMAAFQVALAFGAPLGRFAWGGQHRVLPTSLRIGSGVTVVIYALIGWIILARADLISSGVPDGVINVAAWVIAAYFFLGIWLNLASKSRAERAVMSPLSAVFSVLCVVVALG
jgi:hypothetical protein